jgi:hypothetical protein
MDSAKAALMQQRYYSARQAVMHASSFKSASLEPLYFIVAIEQTRILDYESYIFEGDRFLALCDSVVDIVGHYLDTAQRRPSLWNRFFHASLYGQQSVMHAKMGNWIAALKPAYRSLSLLNDIQKSDPTFSTAYLGTGIFDYYLSALPFMGDRKQKGIADIRRATRAPNPYNYLAINTLCWIYIDEQRYRSTDSLADVVLESYPDNTIFVKIKLLSIFWTQRYTRSIPLARRLIKLSHGLSPVNWCDYITGYYVLCLSYHRLKQRKECTAVLEEVLSVKIPPQYRKISYIKKHITELEELYAHYRDQ